MLKRWMLIGATLGAVGCGPSVRIVDAVDGGADGGGAGGETDGFGHTGGASETNALAETDVHPGGGGELSCFEPAAETVLAVGGYNEVVAGVDGETIVVGTATETTFTTVVRKYDAAGIEQWAVKGPDPIDAIAIDATGNFATLGTGIVRKWGPDGAPLWSVQPPAATSIAVDPDGSVTTSGAGGPRDSPTSIVTRYDKDASEQWSTEFDAWASVIAPMPGGGVVLGIGESFAWRIRALDVNGVQAWDTPVDGPVNPPSVATDPDGNVYVAGSDFETLWLQKLDPNGAAQWTVRDIVGDSHDKYVGIAANAEEIVVAGYVQSVDPLTAFVRRFDRDGEELETVLCPTAPDSRAHAVALDPNGRATIVGSVSVDAGPYRQWIKHYGG